MRRGTAVLMCAVLFLCMLPMPTSPAQMGAPDLERPTGAARVAMDADGLIGRYILPADCALTRAPGRMGSRGTGPLLLPVALVLTLALGGKWAQLYWHALRAFRQHVLVPHSIHAPPRAYPVAQFAHSTT